MPINEVVIHDYEQFLGANREQHAEYGDLLPKLIRAELFELNIGKIDVYRLKGRKHAHGAGRKNERVVIFINGTAEGAGETKENVPITLNGDEFTIEKLLAPKGDIGPIITSDDGIPIAEWNAETYELNILFDVCDEYSEERISDFTYIMKKFNELVWVPKSLENSWKHCTNKQELTVRFTKQIKRQKERELENAKSQLQSWEINVRDYTQKLKTIHDSILQKRHFVETETNNLINITEAIIKDLDLIINIPKVKDLHVKDNKFIIYTMPIYITATNGKRYYGGNYRIEIVPDNTDIRFFGDNPRNGYWTKHDPHPHVNGEDGHGCLGNIGSTVAELCSQMQIYALTLIAIDYLESANLDDSAGKKVTHWEQVDKDGNPIDKKKPTASLVECPRCGSLVDQLHVVYEDAEQDGDDEWIGENEHYVCEECRDEHYYEYEDSGLWLRD